MAADVSCLKSATRSSIGLLPTDFATSSSLQFSLPPPTRIFADIICDLSTPRRHFVPANLHYWLLHSPATARLQDSDMQAALAAWRHPCRHPQCTASIIASRATCTRLNNFSSRLLEILGSVPFLPFGKSEDGNRWSILDQGGSARLSHMTHVHAQDDELFSLGVTWQQPEPDWATFTFLSLLWLTDSLRE